jgi:hypothetical protein
MTEAASWVSAVPWRVTVLGQSFAGVIGKRFEDPVNLSSRAEFSISYVRVSSTAVCRSGMALLAGLGQGSAGSIAGAGMMQAVAEEVEPIASARTARNAARSARRACQ